MPTSTQTNRGTGHPSSAGAPPLNAHSPYLCLATVALAIIALLSLAGCQTPHAPTAVAPPATGMIGQPAPYGGWATAPQGAAYPPVSSAPPMPGPAPTWQGTAPPNTWSWTQPQAAPAVVQQAPPQIAAPQIAAPQMAAPSQPFTTPSSQSISNQTQQYANQMQNSANQQWQQFNNQAQQQANQYANQANQYANQATQQANQYMNQASQQANQYMNQATQQANQYMNQAGQQVTAQMPAYQAAPSSQSWNPFSTSALSQPPARATPVAVPRY